MSSTAPCAAFNFNRDLGCREGKIEAILPIGSKHIFPLGREFVDSTMQREGFFPLTQRLWYFFFTQD
jgi:hypothetical protein